MDQLEIRPFAPIDAGAAARLLRETFDAFVAPDCTAEGCRAFRAFLAPQRLRERLATGHFGYLAWDEENLAGVLMVREPAHLLSLFVDARCHRRGIARALLRRALETVRANAVQVAAMTVNASPYAVEAYARMGFKLEGPRHLNNGVANIPMRLPLDEGFWDAASQQGT